MHVFFGEILSALYLSSGGIFLAPILSTILMVLFHSILLHTDLAGIANWPILGKLVIIGTATWLYQLFRTRSAAHSRIAIVIPFSYLGVVFEGYFGVSLALLRK